MKVKELAEIAGISIRTLHHYDQIGLLTPKTDQENGYRDYSDEDVSKLQQILFFRQLKFKLSRIKEMMNSPDYDTTEALQVQKEIILKEQSRLNDILQLIDKTIKNNEDGIMMTNKEKFDGVDFSQNPYEKEARERWGDRTVDESNKNIKRMNQREAERRFNEIYISLSEVRHLSPDSADAQKNIHEWYVFLNEVGEYTPEMFKGLGDMYVEDRRFTKNIDKYGEGLAKFMQQAMTVYYERHKK